ncbi:metallophosphoesterase family protein [Carboxylicivirga linearis]|uniref:Phosphoesterase n=1 Tax=Carboxylicivirga linearis TaxID=1628157 RepID=A0ABS5JUY5_9BACT|nr:metallophosphoesterase family protein [Carboxylicivirga linearis]MBS2098638.1 metallophosphoesterase family protein [Carboxylicivirga linearis]
MKRIGLLSDTHSYFDARFKELFKDVDEIWHAGDLGDIKVLDEMRNFKPVRAIWGNIDGNNIRQELNEVLEFSCEDVSVYMIHIGGYPGKYEKHVKADLIRKKPQIFVSGHSHILKVMYDKTLDVLHLNPGAAGRSGFHSVRTALRFTIDGKEIKDMEVIELGPKRV